MKTSEQVEKIKPADYPDPDADQKNSTFTKNDGGKPRFDLLPASASWVIDSTIMRYYVLSRHDNDHKDVYKRIEKLLKLSEYLVVDLWEVAEVLTHGSEKYSDNNWKTAKDNNRYWSALGRHLYAYDLDNKGRCPDSGFTHAAHAMCNIMFLIEFLTNR